MSATAKTTSTAHRFLEIFGIAGFCLLEMFLAWRAIAHSQSVLDALVIVGAVLVGFVAADFMSGLVHWAFDRYGSVDTPLFGPNFILPFREHHTDPKGITYHDFVETNGNNCIVTVPILAGAASIDPSWGAFAVFTSCFLGAMCLFVFGTNQFHKWAHQDDPPHWVQALQRWRLILDTPGHDIHHKAPFETYYCITTGWLNPLLAKIRFFELMETTIFRLTGVRGGVDDAKITGKN
ncbi:MAG: kua-ubiquitin conjugating enzyme hybrid localization domain protein [Myxococcales bacterium]|nr:kua-ubiquitin conjugating enzyme hybrid localization domain protein [Myxococcales bacterium]